MDQRKPIGFSMVVVHVVLLFVLLNAICVPLIVSSIKGFFFKPHGVCV